jgi:hypothetical protein
VTVQCVLALLGQLGTREPERILELRGTEKLAISQRLAWVSSDVVSLACVLCAMGDTSFCEARAIQQYMRYTSMCQSIARRCVNHTSHINA